MNTSIMKRLETPPKNASMLLLAGALFLTQTPVHAATLLFDADFESGSLTGEKLDLHATGDKATVVPVTTTVANGKYSGRYDLQWVGANGVATANSYRSETQLLNLNPSFNFNTEYWFSFNYMHTDWAKDKSAEIAPFQIHRVPSDWSQPCGGQVAAVSVAPFLMRSKEDVADIITYGGKISWSGPVAKNKWQNIVFHFDIGWDDNGYVEAWKDGVKLFRREGKLHEQLDDCGKPWKSPTFNMGVYKWDWKLGRPQTQSSRRTLFIDDLKIAQGSNGYAMVTSTVPDKPPIGDTTPPVVSNVQAAVTDSTATLTWETNEASDSSAQYGLTTSYGLSAGNGLAVTTHSLVLKDLKANSLYHYRVSSKDGGGNVGSSGDLTFTTEKAVDAGLVAYWAMDPGTGTKIPDLSGNGHNGYLVNGALLTNSGGVKFDGLNDYLNVGKFDVPGKAITFSAWVWADDLANCTARDCRILSKAVGTEEQDHYFMVSPVKVGTATRLRFRLKTNGVTTTLTAPSGNLANKTWFHVAAVYDGQTMRLYKDGVEVGSMAKSGSLTTNSNAAVWIGGNPPAAKARPWKGQIDDVSLYSYALTQAEIAELAK